MFGHLLAQGAGQLGGTFDGVHPLAVRGIGQNDGFGLCRKVSDIGHLKMAALFHTGQLCVGIGQCHGGGVDM